MKRMYFGGCVLMTLFAMVVGLSICLPSNAEARRCAAIIYEHAGYRGAAQCLQVGSYNVNDIEIGNDTLSSIRVRRGNVVHLFKHKNFSGKQYIVHHDHPYIGDQWNDMVSSIVVE